MIEIKRCGYNVVHPDGLTIDRPQGSGDYLFLFFRSKMEIEVRGELVVADKNTYVIYKKGSKQFYRELEKPFVHDWFHFDGEDAESYIERLSLPFDKVMKVYDPLYISRKVNDIQDETLHNGTYRKEIIDATVRCLLMKLSDMHNRIEASHPLSKFYEPFVRLRNAIRETPSAPHTVDRLAAQVNMSRSHFQSIYKELFGVPVMRDVIQTRLEYAMYLLENSSDSIGDIARSCGYENDVHFMRQFKKYIHVTPSQYRAAYRSS
ncbi:AraC family transcriptional regulator [Paenibacillus sp.]|uniref:AraC family transcriptional regulator n=1 Tax=Paenibacillus sp. TaxID=58172 RepID=UPI002D446A7A|nr:AraC family transcriptional regulator [Paenibacillus sp.]HZG85917.1 AraC family transcriptional regulator [Paenibacillus sp.]